MKILAPVRHPEEVAALCEAGADELYCGLTPQGWSERFGGAWVHRRNPASAGVPGPSELDAIVTLAGARPVYATLNAPAYPSGSLPFLTDFARALLEEHGVSGLIVADLDLLLALRDAGFAGRLHLSSLATCVNPRAALFFRDLGVTRVVLPRHLSLDEIEAVAAKGVETEAFLLNDGCVFEEGLCATTHDRGPFCLADGEGNEGLDPETRERYELKKWTLNNCGCQTSRGFQLGPCGLCALPRLRAAGVASLKVVGREASLARKLGSVRLAKAGRDLALAGAAPEAIREAVIGLRGAPELCEDGLLCYYPDVWKVSNRPLSAPSETPDAGGGPDRGRRPGAAVSREQARSEAARTHEFHCPERVASSEVRPAAGNGPDPLPARSSSGPFPTSVAETLGQAPC